MADKFIQVTIEFDDSIKPFIFPADNGKKYLTFNVTPRKNGVDQYGHSHAVAIRYRADDGKYYNKYIGSGTEKEFGAPVPPPPSAPAQPAYQQPQGGYQQPFAPMMPPTQPVQKTTAQPPMPPAEQYAPADDNLPF